VEDVLLNKAASAGQRLLRTPAPQPDESLMGYLLRLAEANHYDSPKWILELAGLKLSSLAEGWRRLCQERIDFTLLRQLTGLTQSEIEALKHKLSDGEEYGHNSGDTNGTVPAEAVRFGHPKICPACLRESNYCRKLWDLLVITVCPRHQGLLSDRCPHCERRMSWNRKQLSLCRCGYDLRQTPTPRLEKSAFRATEWLMTSLTSTLCQGAAVCPEEFLFRRLSFGDLSRVLLCLAEFLPVGETALRLHSGLENRLCHQALEQAVAVLEDWPTGFHRFCEQNLTELAWAELASRLNRLADRDTLAFLRVALEEYLEKLSRLPNPTIDVLIERRFLPLDQARERVGLGRRSFEILLFSRKLRVTSSVSSPHQLLIDEKSIRTLLDQRKWMLIIEQAACVLGISENELGDLLEHGCLKVASGPLLDGFPDIRLEMVGVVGLYERLKQRAEPAEKGILLIGLSKELIGLEAVRAHLKANHLSLGQWLRAALDEEVTPIKLLPLVGHEFNGYSLNHFAFRREQFEQYLKVRCPNAAPLSIQPRQRRRHITAKELRELVELLQGKWERQQLTFTRKGLEAYSAAQLGNAAKAIIERSKDATP
jgi:hypothetical protein